MIKSKYQELWDAIEAMEILDVLSWKMEIDWDKETITNRLKDRWPDRVLKGHLFNGTIYLLRLK